MKSSSFHDESKLRTRSLGSHGPNGPDELALARVAIDAGKRPSLGEARALLLAKLVERFDADSAHLLDARTDLASQSRGAVVGVTDEHLRAYGAAKASYDASNKRMLEAMLRGACVDSDVYSSSERSSLAIYRDILLPQRTRSVLGAFASLAGMLVVRVVFKRHGTRRAFAERDVRELQRELPMIAFADAALQHRFAGTASQHALAPLTPREREVAQLACKGCSNREIASLLGTSPDTVKKQLSAAMKKLDVLNRTELASLLQS